MSKQIIVSISREYGSGGHYIAEKLSKELGIKIFDRNMLDMIGEERGWDMTDMKKYDESHKSRLFNRKVRGMSSSPEDNLAQMQFEYIQKKAASGESMIIVGRCADSVLKGNEALTTIFVMGDMKEKMARIMKVRTMDEHDAEKAIQRHDKNRRNYHNTYSETKWGDSRYYDLCINSSKLGLDQTVEILKDYLTRIMEG